MTQEGNIMDRVVKLWIDGEWRYFSEVTVVW